jgi:hypothetical protein
MTPQISDTLLYQNEVLRIEDEPLAPYLRTIQLPYKLEAPNSTCWRGYQAQWALDEKKLFLIGWEGYILDFQKVGMAYLFPGEDFVFAHWYTGKIKIPRGEPLQYVHGGFGAVHEANQFLIFKNGYLEEDYTLWLSEDEIKALDKDEDIWY